MFNVIKRDGEVADFNLRRSRMRWKKPLKQPIVLIMRKYWIVSA
jgi:hypothetical protein